MSKNILLFAIACFIGVCVLFSCSKVESDSNPPVIEFISFDSEIPLQPGYVLYTDSLYTFKSIFRDDEGLSSYSIKIWSAIMENERDTFTLKSSINILPEGTSDSAIFNTAFQDTNIFGIRDTSVTAYTSIRIGSTKSTKQGTLPILLEDHYLKVTLVDIHGNVAKDSLIVRLKSKSDLKK